MGTKTVSIAGKHAAQHQNGGSDPIDITGLTGSVTNGDSHDHTSGAGATIPIAGGGTGQTTAQAAIDALTAVSGATIGHALVKDADGHATWAAPSGGGSVLYSVAYAAGASGNWTAPDGVYMVYLSGGAGGGGGGKYSAPDNGGGGGAGACCNRYPFRVVPGSVYAYSVGSGGAGGTSTTGYAGGNTSFGGLVLQGGRGGSNNGGAGGMFGNIPGKSGGTPSVAPGGSNSDTYDSAVCVGAGGGTGASASIGDGGDSPVYAGGLHFGGASGGGGASLYGAGGNAGNTGVAGGLCAGGGDGYNGNGGAGGDGFLLIEYWIAETP